MEPTDEQDAASNELAVAIKEEPQDESGGEQGLLLCHAKPRWTACPPLILVNKSSTSFVFLCLKINGLVKGVTFPPFHG